MQIGMFTQYKNVQLILFCTCVPQLYSVGHLGQHMGHLGHPWLYMSCMYHVVSHLSHSVQLWYKCTQQNVSDIFCTLTRSIIVIFVACCIWVNPLATQGKPTFYGIRTGENDFQIESQFTGPNLYLAKPRDSLGPIFSRAPFRDEVEKELSIALVDCYFLNLNLYCNIHIGTVGYKYLNFLLLFFEFIIIYSNY